MMLLILVQLHGQETNEYIKILKQKIDVPIIKAIQIKNDDSFNVDYDVDYYLSIMVLEELGKVLIGLC